MADPLIPFHKNGESMFLEEPHRPLNWKIESRTGERNVVMWSTDPNRVAHREYIQVNREHISRFTVGTSPIDNLPDFIGSCIAINSSFTILSLSLGINMSVSFSLCTWWNDVEFCVERALVKPFLMWKWYEALLNWSHHAINSIKDNLIKMFMS